MNKSIMLSALLLVSSAFAVDYVHTSSMENCVPDMDDAKCGKPIKMECVFKRVGKVITQHMPDNEKATFKIVGKRTTDDPDVRYYDVASPDGKAATIYIDPNAKRVYVQIAGENNFWVFVVEDSMFDYYK